MKKRINILPKELRSEVPLTPESALLPCALGVFALMFLYSISLSVRSRTLHGHINRKTMEESTVAGEIARLTNELKIASGQRDRILFINAISEKKSYWSEVFKEFSHLIPEHVWLTAFASVQNAENRVFSLKGETDSQEKVAEFFSSMEKSYFFGKVVLLSSEKGENIEPHLYKFEFQITVNDSASKGKL